MEMTRLLEHTKKQLSDATGLKPVTATRAFKDELGWHVGVEMLEMSRIPNSTDVLGEYETLLNDEGHLLKFERRRTRLRGEASGNGT
jgi:hypothetical protein